MMMMMMMNPEAYPYGKYCTNRSAQAIDFPLTLGNEFWLCPRSERFRRGCVNMAVALRSTLSDNGTTVTATIPLENRFRTAV